MYILLSVVLILAVGIFLFMNRPEFGKPPSKKRREAYTASPNFRNGVFNNLNHTPAFAEGVTYTKVLREFLFKKNPNKIPPFALPSVKTDLHKLLPDENVIVWFGHSSYFIQVDGLKILVDPVFSGNASPLPNTMKSFPGSDIYKPGDMPDLDLLIITHDHWDHLDHSTVLALKPRVKHIITGLGVGEHLENWGFSTDMFTEKDWHDTITLKQGYTITSAPARHFSGRSFKRNVSLWSSFILQTPSMKIYIGGDSGYDDHFKTIGKQYGPFDLAILECGQYNYKWRYIHMLPEEVVPAAQDLGARHLMIVHWAKFPLSEHNWNEPPAKVTAYARQSGMPLVTPMIGEKIKLDMLRKDWPEWWSLQEA